MQSAPEPRLTLQNATLFYGLMASVALFWVALSDDASAAMALPSNLDAWAWGGGAGLVIATVSWWLEPRVPSLRRLSSKMSSLLSFRSVWSCWWVALASGVAEELLFRAAMQHTLGYVVTGLLFALAHGGLDRQWHPWPLFALVVGLTLGLLVAYVESVWPAALAHVIVNGVGLTRLSRLEASK